MDEQENVAFLMMVVQMGYLSYNLLKNKQIKKTKIKRKTSTDSHKIKSKINKKPAKSNNKSSNGVKIKRFRKRKYWVHPSCSVRSTEGYFEKNFAFVKEDEELLFKSTCMTKIQFELLVNINKEHLEKWSKRKAIDPECRIVLTLMYLTEGASLKSLATSFHMGLTTVRKIIVEVCEVFWKVLKPVYMPELSKRDWKEISQKYADRYNMPHCLGSIDGKHIQVKRPAKANEIYFNYKCFDSIVVLGICDTNYIFTAVDVLTEGNDNDGIILRNSSIGKKIFENNENLPIAEKLPNSDKLMPYYFVAGSAFPLRKNLMRPYPGDPLSPEKVFNCTLSKARHTADNTFGVLSARWKVLTKCFGFEPINTKKVIYACVILHNFLTVTGTSYNCNLYCPENYCDTYDEHDQCIDGIWRQESLSLLSVRKCSSNHSSKDAVEVRQTLTNYLSNIS